MIIENYLNIDGIEMVLTIENNQAVSMTKVTYDEMIAKREAPSL